MVIDPVIYGDGQQILSLQLFSDLKFKGKEPSQMASDLFTVQIDLCEMGDRFTAQNDTLMSEKRFRK